MATLEIPTATGVTLSERAAEEIRGLLERQGKTEAALRVFVSGGGCSGLQYGMAFDDNVRPEDQVIETDGVKVIVDEYSVQHIRGSEIDYVDSLMGAGFTVHNPNAVHSCSCGHSFDTGEDAGEAKACGCGH